MQSEDSSQNIFTFLVILNFVIVILVACTSLGSSYGQLQTLYELAKHTPNQVAAIPVDKSPVAIGVDEFQSKVYVANFGNDTVSVINALNSAKIGTIQVGSNPIAIGVDSWIPLAIGIDEPRDKVYVANFYNNTVSVIDSKSNANTTIGTIKVGEDPIAIGVDSDQGKVYVANSNESTVSVINPKSNSNTTIGTIKVGNNPIAIGVDNSRGKVYVANKGDNTTSVIDEVTDKVIAAVTFGVNPFNAGHIECEKLIVPIAEQFYIGSGSECTAKPNQGFDFVSWQEK